MNDYFLSKTPHQFQGFMILIFPLMTLLSLSIQLKLGRIGKSLSIEYNPLVWSLTQSINWQFGIGCYQNTHWVYTSDYDYLRLEFTAILLDIQLSLHREFLVELFLSWSKVRNYS